MGHSSFFSGRPHRLQESLERPVISFPIPSPIAQNAMSRVAKPKVMRKIFTIFSSFQSLQEVNDQPR